MSNAWYSMKYIANLELDIAEHFSMRNESGNSAQSDIRYQWTGAIDGQTPMARTGHFLDQQCWASTVHHVAVP